MDEQVLRLPVDIEIIDTRWRAAAAAAAAADEGASGC
jgi:hypothetical protein